MLCLIKKMISTIYNTPDGLPSLTLTAHDGKLVGVDWSWEKTKQYFGAAQMVDKLTLSDRDCVVLYRTIQALNGYFESKKPFDLPIEFLVGTDFQKSVWQTLCTIECGQTITYKELAQKVGRPNAYRAVGSANGKNPISLIVPCHRVVAADGLGGYTGGADIKAWLLAHEAA